MLVLSHLMNIFKVGHMFKDCSLVHSIMNPFYDTMAINMFHGLIIVLIECTIILVKCVNLIV